ncbi:hypothetical protein K438DRAFT_1980667 [Mycena galopus ATCC 62051]|nr:hypothetical protein K438DRAFT_1980667 [Mycena galopus ATCC 62051]
MLNANTSNLNWVPKACPLPFHEHDDEHDENSPDLGRRQVQLVRWQGLSSCFLRYSYSRDLRQVVRAQVTGQVSPTQQDGGGCATRAKSRHVVIQLLPLPITSPAPGLPVVLLEGQDDYDKIERTAPELQPSLCIVPGRNRQQPHVVPAAHCKAPKHLQRRLEPRVVVPRHLPRENSLASL